MDILTVGLVSCVPVKLIVSLLQLVSQKVGGGEENQLQEERKIKGRLIMSSSRSRFIMLVLSNLNPLIDYLR